MVLAQGTEAVQLLRFWEKLKWQSIPNGELHPNLYKITIRLSALSKGK